MHGTRTLIIFIECEIEFLHAPAAYVEMKLVLTEERKLVNTSKWL